MYGLEQAPRAWFDKFSTMVTSCFCSSANDLTLFVKSNFSSCILLSLYLNSVIIIGDDIGVILILKHELALQFDMKDLGPLHDFFDIKVIHSPCNQN